MEMQTVYLLSTYIIYTKVSRCVYVSMWVGVCVYVCNAVRKDRPITHFLPLE